MRLKQSIVIFGTVLCLVFTIIFLSSQFTSAVSSFNVNCLTNQRSPFLKIVDLILRVVIISYLGVGTLSYSPRFERYLEIIPKNYKFISLVIITLIFLLIMDSVFASSVRISYNCR